MSQAQPSFRKLFARTEAYIEAQFMGVVSRTETVGGAPLLAPAVIAVVWANSPATQAYQSLWDTVVGPATPRRQLPG